MEKLFYLVYLCGGVLMLMMQIDVLCNSRKSSPSILADLPLFIYTVQMQLLQHNCNPGLARKVQSQHALQLKRQKAVQAMQTKGSYVPHGKAISSVACAEILAIPVQNSSAHRLMKCCIFAVSAMYSYTVEHTAEDCTECHGMALDIAGCHRCPKPAQ